MLDVALKVQESISWYISSHLDMINKGDQLSVQDWAQLRTIYVMAAIRITWIIAKRDVTGGLGMDIY